jgi:hypothetical protein
MPRQRPCPSCSGSGKCALPEWVRALCGIMSAQCVECMGTGIEPGIPARGLRPPTDEAVDLARAHNKDLDDYTGGQGQWR